MNDSLNNLSYKGIENINCPICNIDDTVFLFSAPVQKYQEGIFSYDKWNIVKCKKCGLVYVNPRISRTANENYYKFELQGDHEFLDTHFLESAPMQTKYWERMVRLIQKFKTTGRWLDVGCGSGALLVQARSKGYHVSGQEISPFFIDFCRNTHQLEVFNGELDTFNIRGEVFDIISCFDVIEHHRHPLSLLTEIRRILKPNGLLVISTHDFGNVFARIYGNKWRMIYPIGHLFYFTRNTMKRLLEQSGFRIISIGCANTIDTNVLRMILNSIRSFFTTIVLRSLILWIYKPISSVLPFIQNWQIKYKGVVLCHKLLLFKAGSQLISNDEMVIIACPIKK